MTNTANTISPKNLTAGDTIDLDAMFTEATDWSQYEVGGETTRVTGLVTVERIEFKHTRYSGRRRQYVVTTTAGHELWLAGSCKLTIV